MADALSRIPTEELFTFDENTDFPLNLQLIAATDAKLQEEFVKLQEALAKQPPKYEEEIKEGTKLYVQVNTAAISPYGLRTVYGPQYKKP